MKKLKVGDKARLSNVDKKLEGHPCKVLSVNTGMERKHIYAEVFFLEKGKASQERRLFDPESVVKETNSGVLALWKELETAQEKLAKIEKVFDHET